MGRWALVALVLVACGGDSTSSITLGETCIAVGQAACERGSECELLGGDTIATCESQFVTACCGGPPNTCTQKAKDAARAQRYIDACSSDFTNWDCITLSQGGLPVSCIAPE